jgi:hypothetical protein
LLTSQGEQWASITTPTSIDRASCAVSPQNGRNSHAAGIDRPHANREQEMAKSQQRGNKETRKPKKAVPKSNVSKPSTKGLLANLKG